MAKSDLVRAIESFTKDLAEKAETFVQDVTNLEVRTFTSPKSEIMMLATDALDASNQEMMHKVELRAYTKIDFDSDTTVCVPVDENDQVDRAVWDIHHSMVDQALTNREAMLRSMGDALTSALRALQQLGE